MRTENFVFEGLRNVISHLLIRRRYKISHLMNASAEGLMFVQRTVWRQFQSP